MNIAINTVLNHSQVMKFRIASLSFQSAFKLKNYSCMNLTRYIVSTVNILWLPDTGI